VYSTLSFAARRTLVRSFRIQLKLGEQYEVQSMMQALHVPLYPYPEDP
jgi:hypothetical protein